MAKGNRFLIIHFDKLSRLNENFCRPIFSFDSTIFYLLLWMNKLFWFLNSSQTFHQKGYSEIYLIKRRIK